MDDEPANVRLLKRLLERAGYRRLKTFTDPVEAVQRFREIRPDLLLLDLHMPQLDGVEVMECLRAEIPISEYFPILILTGDSSPEACQRALTLGAMDVVTKPFNVHEVLLRIRNLLETRSLHRQVGAHNQVLEMRVQERTAELESAQMDTIARLAMAAEFRDDETGRHAQRVGELSKILGLAMGLEKDEATLLGRAAPLHDLGKIGISDAVLRKPGPLTEQEREAMKCHTTIGARILSGGRSKFILLAEWIAHYHHERWDGNGYPTQLAGEAIPAAARVVAVADFFDATVHERIYRKAWPVQKVLATIAELSGIAFDPVVATLCERSDIQQALLAVTGGETL